MRFLYLTVICVVGVAGTMVGYQFARPGNPAGSTEQEVASRLHDHSSHAGPANIPADSPTDWCAEHWVPESECTLCHPDLIETFQRAANWCGEHNMPETHCRKCNPKLTFAQEPVSEEQPISSDSASVSVFFPANESGCTNDKALIQFASSEMASRSGIVVQPIVTTRDPNTVEAPAEVVFDETRVRALSTTVAASVVRWLVNPGQRIKVGQSMAELESPDIVEWEADFLNATADWQVDSVKLQRAAQLRKSHLISDAEWQDTQGHALSTRSRLSGAVGKLQSAGMSDDDISRIAATEQISSRFELKATSDGTIIKRQASLGELLPPGSTLAIVGDGSALWIEAHVRQQDISKFKMGDRVLFTSDDQSLTHADGTVIWVADYLDPATRTGLVRARIIRASSSLFANIFGRLGAAKATEQATLLVPKEAVQWEGCCNVVFVQEAPNRYRPHKVAIDRGDNRHYAVLAGLRSSDMVVTNGSFFLKTELLKDKLGVGCTGE